MTYRNLAGGLSIAAAAVLLTLVAGADEAPPKIPEYKTVFVPTVPLSSKEFAESMPARAGGSRQGAGPAATVGREVEADPERFARDVESVIRALAADGYVVESTVPMISGIYRWGQDLMIKRSNSAGAAGFGYGYSVTAGVTIIARRD